METFGALLDTILGAISALGGGNTWSAMLALAAAGTISMAALQVIKELTPLRQKYQRCWFECWIDSRAKDFEAAVKNRTLRAPDVTVDAAEVKQQVVELATGGLAEALYDLQVEDMVPQINLAAQITLDDPTRYKMLLAVLSEGASFADLMVVMEGQPTSGPTQSYFDARNRITRRIQRNLDGVRIALGNRWRFWMQVFSLALTTCVVEAALGADQQATWGAYWLALPIGLVGGYLAPITRDLLAALQKLRNPS